MTKTIENAEHTEVLDRIYRIEQDCQKRVVSPSFFILENPV